MSIAVGSGFPNASGVLIPEIWSGKLLTKFYASTVLGAITNTDYEGEISNHGDKVHIRTVPDVAIYDYARGTSLRVQTPTNEKVELNIDHAKYFNIHIDDVDKFQSDINYMEAWTRDASTQMKIVQDRHVLGTVYADAHPANRGNSAGLQDGTIDLGSLFQADGTTPGTNGDQAVALTKSNIIDFLVDIGVVFDDQNVPEEDRKVVLPNWAVALIKKSDLKDASLAGDGTSILRNGRVGMVDRLEIFGSNNLATTTQGTAKLWNAMACHKSAITWASQIVKAETIKAESTFGHLARGLQVYGFKVLKPESLAHLLIRKG